MQLRNSLCCLFLAIAALLCGTLQANCALWYATHDGTNWRYQNIDPNIGFTESASLRLDSMGRPQVSYFVPTRCDDPSQIGCGDLAYATRSGRTWLTQTLEPGYGSYGIGARNSLAIDTLDRPHIAYTGNFQDGLKHASYDGSTWTLESVDQEAWAGSIDIGPSGQPMIGVVKRWESAEPGIAFATYGALGWKTVAVDSTFQDAYDVSLAIDSQGNPHLTYYDGTAQDLRYATRSDGRWEIETIDADGNTGWESSLVIDDHDVPHVAYYDAEELTAQYAVRTQNGWETNSLNEPGHGYPLGADTSLAIDEGGVPHLAFRDARRRTINYATLNGDEWKIETIANDGYITSLALDAAGRPHIVFSQGTPVPEPASGLLATVLLLSVVTLTRRQNRR